MFYHILNDINVVLGINIVGLGEEIRTRGLVFELVVHQTPTDKLYTAGKPWMSSFRNRGSYKRHVAYFYVNLWRHALFVNLIGVFKIALQK